MVWWDGFWDGLWHWVYHITTTSMKESWLQNENVTLRWLTIGLPWLTMIKPTHGKNGLHNFSFEIFMAGFHSQNRTKLSRPRPQIVQEHAGLLSKDVQWRSRWSRSCSWWHPIWISFFPEPWAHQLGPWAGYTYIPQGPIPGYPRMKKIQVLRWCFAHNVQFSRCSIFLGLLQLYIYTIIIYYILCVCTRCVCIWL